MGPRVPEAPVAPRDRGAKGRRGETFKVEYLYYVVVVSVLVAVCLLALNHSLRESRRAKEAERRGRRSAAHRPSEEPLPPARLHAAIERDLQQVPTPWGWPGSELHHGHHGHGADEHGGSFQHWVDRLVREKRTVEDSDYRLRRSASLRALLEDRYGRAVEPGSQHYEKVRPPRLRDPSLPHDQQDNFPSGKTGQIMNKLTRQHGQPVSTGSRRGRRGLKEVKTPWGW